VQSLAGRPVTLITHDTGQATRVRFTELTLMKLPAPQLSDSTAAG
jgi:hypothetical protein